MIIVDTNVVSEPLRAAPDPLVLAWLDRQPAAMLHVTSITLAELRFGVAALPQGRRRQALETAVEERLLALFGPRILDFDAAAATAYARIRAGSLRVGRNLPIPDAYLAAIAAAHGFAVATRDAGPFEAAGVPVIDPWAAR